MSNIIKQVVAGQAPYATDVDQFRQILSGKADVGVLSIAGVLTAPSAPAVASGATGVVNGTYKYILVAVTGWVENNNTMHVNGFASSAESTITVTSKQVTVTIPSLVAPVIAYLIYRTIAGGATGTEKYCGYTIGPTSFTDNVADGSLGTGMPSWLGTSVPAAVPTINTTGSPIQFGAYGQFNNGLGVLGGLTATSAITTYGMTGAGASSRYVGATTSGSPTSGTFLAGDFIIDQTGNIWICITTGTPGTWVKPGNIGYQIITTTSTFTVPLGVTRIYVQMIGGGGGGAGGWGNATGTGLVGGVAGGGAGGYAATWMSVTPGQNITATVGAGGAGGAGGSATGSGNTLGGTGTTGGTTAFNGVGSYGGSGGNPSNTTSGSPGGIGVGCPLLVTGGVGGYWSSFNSSGASGGTAANGGALGYGTGGTGGGQSPGYSPNAGSPGQAGTSGAVIIIW